MLCFWTNICMLLILWHLIIITKCCLYAVMFFLLILFVCLQEEENHNRHCWIMVYTKYLTILLGPTMLHFWKVHHAISWILMTFYVIYWYLFFTSIFACCCFRASLTSDLYDLLTGFCAGWCTWNKEICLKLGAGEDLYALCAWILTMRPWNRLIDPAVDHLAIQGNASDHSDFKLAYIAYIRPHKAMPVTLLLTIIPFSMFLVYLVFWLPIGHSLCPSNFNNHPHENLPYKRLLVSFKKGPQFYFWVFCIRLGGKFL